jgi:hypothetical protein
MKDRAALEQLITSSKLSRRIVSMNVAAAVLACASSASSGDGSMGVPCAMPPPAPLVLWHSTPHFISCRTAGLSPLPWLLVFVACDGSKQFVNNLASRACSIRQTRACQHLLVSLQHLLHHLHLSRLHQDCINTQYGALQISRTHWCSPCLPARRRQAGAGSFDAAPPGSGQPGSSSLRSAPCRPQSHAHIHAKAMH